MNLSDIVVGLEGLHEEINIEQTGETIYINQDTEAVFDAEKRKTFDKTYKVSSSDALSIHNKFGNVAVNTWAKNEIKVKVDVISRAATDAKAQEILDNINIIDSRSGSIISVVTKMSPMRVSGNTSKSFEINYTIYMPEANALTVKNSFGDVNLASLKGKADISVTHGALKTERLNNSDNNVKVAYGSGSCGYINGGNVNLSYGDLYVGGANGLTGNASYGNFKVGQLTEEMDMTFKHGSFKVDNVSKNIKKIALDSNYGTVSLNFADNTAFNFDVNVQFGDFKVDKSLINITSLEKGYTSAEYKGRFGGSSPKGVVNINSKFGDVKFTK
ncbi:DUF4097 family beta strand repeat-containing protein [Pontibacter aydingkolensis]|uniref:DUF4097 family beta strand repeat-containing protein n=2 Tax=Pontibacter aydingkolensis TaxID=1911536 RepID=A0ABS7CPD2_9BACT|nr:DUF4097 family beta strand repeat-containing protein [Pontibacter aydingkolensis]